MRYFRVILDTPYLLDCYMTYKCTSSSFQFNLMVASCPHMRAYYRCTQNDTNHMLSWVRNAGALINYEISQPLSS